jgi:radical SAM superfamily enzyme YgiQ (UPF0313 family)
MTRALLITLYGLQNTGIRLLCAVLREAGFDAQILYMKRWANNDVSPPTQAEYKLLQNHVRDFDPHLIGIGFGTPYLQIAKEMTEKIRQAGAAHIVWGGVHPTLCPEDCIEHADSVCIGEGEYPLLDLACAIRDQTSFANIENLWVRQDGSINKNPLRPLIQNLDSLPYEKAQSLPAASIEDNKLSPTDPMAGNAIYRIFASRGCPFHCAFCYNNQYRDIYKGLGKYHRTRSVKSVLNELEQARHSYPAMRRSRFDDDSFVFPQTWIDEFTRDYPQRIGLPFDILLNPQTCSKPQLAALKKAGLIHVQAGIQSASASELRDDYKRDGTGEQILELANHLHELHIEMTFDVILDNPLSVESDKKQMVDFLLKLPRPFNLFLYSLTIFPKSEIAQKLLAKGLISENDIEGRATKSFRQFRLTLDYPRSPQDTFYACLITLTSKGFVPRSLIVGLSNVRWLKSHPTPLRIFAESVNIIKLAGTAFTMLVRGELSLFKLREYASFKRRLIQ